MTPEDRDPDDPLGADISAAGPQPSDVSVVDQTGIVLVHEGEVISAPPSSQARLRHGQGAPVTIRLPVEIQVVGGIDEEQIRVISERVFRDLEQALASTD